MDDAEITVGELVFLLLWNCLFGTPKSLFSPVFLVVLSSQAIVRQLFDSASLSFAPGLYDVLVALKPPNIVYFKSLPTALKDFWAIYLVVLEKAGCKPLIYIGSGTARKQGVWSRFLCYLGCYTLPFYVQKAMNDGYEMTHYGLLCWAPTPTLIMMFPQRVLFLALETTFSFVFWSMKSRKSDYCMSHAFFWSLDDVQYDGLCSHSPLTEGVDDTMANLSAEQLEACEKMRRDRHNKRQRERRGSRAAGFMIAYKAAHPELRCEPCDVHFTSPSDLAIHKETTSHMRKVGLDQTPPTYAQTMYAENIAEKRFPCLPCDKYFGGPDRYVRHCKSQKHIDQAAALGVSAQPIDRIVPRRNAADTNTYCSLCDVTCANHESYKVHCGSKKHRQRLNPEKSLYKDTKQNKRAAKMKASKKHYCATCDVAFPAAGKLSAHQTSQKHKDKAAALERATQTRS